MNLRQKLISKTELPKTTLTADELLYELSEDFSTSNDIFSIGRTYFDDEYKKYICGVIVHYEDDMDYAQFAYGSSIKEALINYKNKYTNERNNYV